MRGKEACWKAFAHAEANSKKDKSELSKKFLETHFLSVETPVAPSSIIWKNIQYSPCNRAIRSILIWIVALAIVAAAFIGMVRFKDWGDEIKAGASLEVKCPPDPVEPELALIDWDKPGKQREGMMHCYCLAAYNENGGNVASTMEVWQGLRPDIEENPCEEWKWVYEKSFYLIIITGAMIGALNGICVALFEHIVILEKCQTYAAQTKAQFTRIVTI